MNNPNRTGQHVICADKIDEINSKEYKYIGQRVLRVDGYEKVTGSLKFGADIELPGQLIAKCLHSPYAHARIKSINVSRAEKLPGVAAVVTGKDYDILVGCYLNDTHIFATDRVLFVGDIVAAVAAETAQIAEKALELIEVDYEELPAVLSVEDAIREDAVILHPDLMNYDWIEGICYPKEGTNISNHFKLRHGDVEKGFAESDHIFEDTFRVPMIQHSPMETHACVAHVEAGDRITLHSNTQGPFLVQHMISAAFGIPCNKICVHTTGIGGGFGAKIIAKQEICAVPLALKTHRPVKLVFDRSEEYINTFVRQGLVMKLKTGVKNNGRIIAREIECLWDGGAFNDYGVSIATCSGFTAAGPYNIQNVKVDSYSLYTNKPAGGAFRGFGVAETSTCQEQQIDMIAERLGIDADEMRQINFYQEGDLHATGDTLHSVGVTDCQKKVKEMFSRSTLEEVEGKLYGRGSAYVQKFSMHTVTCSAIVKINMDNSVTLLHAVSEIGQGSRTVMTQIVAEVLDIPPETIYAVPADTFSTPYSWETAASKSTFFDGNAVKLAAEDAKRQLLDLACERFGVSKQEVVLKEGNIYPQDHPELAQGYGELCFNIPYPLAVNGYGVFTIKDATDPDPETGQGKRNSAFWMFGGQGAEVYVDPETGEVELARMVAAHDAGKIINPMTAEGQLEGSISQGSGIALYEEMHFDAKGRLLNDSFTDYKIATSLDCPQMEVGFVEIAPHRDGPYGAKGLGEPGIAPTAPAIANAIYRACGVRLNVIPLTSERIWRAMKDKKMQE